MRIAIPITPLFLDIGGVLLTNGWDHRARKRAAANFKLEWAEMEERHQLNFATHEEGKLTRKPDADIFRLALDIAQAPVEQVVYIKNIPTFVQIAEGFGIRSILHADYRSTCEKLASLGLQHDEEVIQ